MAKNTITRRGFFAVGCVSAMMAGVGGVGALTRQAEATYVRPPGMESQLDLNSRCNRCQRCLQACPYNIITPISLGENIVGSGTPILDFTLGYCDFCMLCVDACPTGALRHGAATATVVGVAKIIKDACIAWDWTGCTICKDECPVEGAIMLDNHERPVVDERLCDGCGRCEQVCPSASLRAYNNAAEKKGVIVVSRESVAAQAEGAVSGLFVRDNKLTKKDGA